MTVSETTIRQQLPFTLRHTNFSSWLGERHVGKVRDSYRYGRERIMVATDRISAFDFGVGHVPFKGQVLTQLSQFWFENTSDIVPNHVLAVPDPNVTIGAECTVLPVEVVARGYITGVTTTAMWRQYSEGARVFCGHTLPEGLKKNQKLPTPLVTPSTKESRKGVHDRSVAPETLISGVLDWELYKEIESIALKLFARGTELAQRAGYILVDTKYEFGLNSEGALMLVDEIHTPDSSRYWLGKTYQSSFRGGKEMDYYDKEHVRIWLAERGLDRFEQDAERSDLPDQLFIETGAKFISVYEDITGRAFEATVGDPLLHVEENLRAYTRESS